MRSTLLTTTELVCRLCDLRSQVPTGCAPPSLCSPLLPGVPSLSSCLLVLPRMVQFLLVHGAAWLWVSRPDFSPCPPAICVGILGTCPSASTYPPAASRCLFCRTTSRLLLLFLHRTEPSSRPCPPHPRSCCANLRNLVSWRDHHLKAQLLFRYAPKIKTLSPAYANGMGRATLPTGLSRRVGQVVGPYPVGTHRWAAKGGPVHGKTHLSGPYMGRRWDRIVVQRSRHNRSRPPGTLANQAGGGWNQLPKTSLPN